MNAENAPEEVWLLDRAAGGDIDAWGALLLLHEERLKSIANFRLDARLRGRIDAADVIQDAFIDATTHRAEFFQQSSQTLFLWLRWIVGNTLLDLHRHHFGAQKRDARREVLSDHRSNADHCPDTTRAALVAQLTSGATGPSTAAGRAELHARLNEALSKMDATDREVLALRHYEQLTSVEAAQVLGIQERAAAKRYTRAIVRLRDILEGAHGSLSELRL
jgi:RNA polymerase sigma-70 factor (ECF subfamily)